MGVLLGIALGLLISLSAGITAGDASGADVARNDPSLVTYESQPGDQDDVTMTFDPGSGGYNPSVWRFTRVGLGAPIAATSPCTGFTGASATCPYSAAVRFRMYDGNDVASIRFHPSYGTASIDYQGGTGNDTVTFADFRGTFDGGNGDDTMLGLSGTAPGAAETFLGGAGDDTLGYPDSRDDIQGGGGTDTVVAAVTDSAISLDGRANDGTGLRLANVHPDVENVRGGTGADEITGSDGSNILEGGEGSDFIVGNGGGDSVYGGAGNDVIDARDGEADVIDCGAGQDSVTVDALDGWRNCEGVSRPDDDGDGHHPPEDCDDRNANVWPGAPEEPGNSIDEDCSGADTPRVSTDRDGDGAAVPLDCDDGNPAIRPGAPDIPGNAVDEDCAGGPAPYPPLDSTITATFVYHRTHTVFTGIVIRRARSGSTVRLKCTGRGCKTGTMRRAVKRDQGKLSLSDPLRGARLRPGARLEVRVTRPDTVGIVARYTVRAGKAPARRDYCLPPRSERPGRCSA